MDEGDRAPHPSSAKLGPLLVVATAGVVVAHATYAFSALTAWELANHGVPQTLIDETFAVSKAFYDQPSAVRMASAATLEHWRGYVPSKLEGEGGARSFQPQSFQPMNVNFGLFPPVEGPARDAEGNRIKGKERGAAKKRALTARALADLERWLAAPRRAAAE